MTQSQPSPHAPQLGDATWTQVNHADGKRPILLVPLGSCEQHGPHLPLDTDTRIACAVANGVASALPHVVVAPALGITASGEHQGFAGTLSIGSAALELVIIELVRSADWSAGVALINGHGGNLDAIKRAVAVLTAEGRRVTSWWPSIEGADAHAGRTETSLMLDIAPHLVRTEALEPGRTDALRDLLPQLRAGGVVSVSPNGVLGDPTGANSGEGAALLSKLVADATTHVTKWRSS